MDEAKPGQRLEREHLELALHVAGLGEFEWDRSRDVLIVSARMAAIAGLPPGEVPADGGEALYRTALEEDRELVARELQACLSGRAPCDFEYRRPDPRGGVRWVRLAAVLSAPESQCMIGVVQDVTERRVEEEQRHTLMAELDHRVKNVLAAVQALAFQTAKRTTSLDSFLTTFAGRLKSMGSANELLTAARWRGAAVDHLCAAELGGIAPGQTRWEGPELFLTPRAANALSLAMHELATNALKYGALSTERGRVEVRWTRQPDGGFELTWTESGGPMVRAPTHRGFGSTLLEQVTGRELNGESRVEYRPTGVRVQLRAGPAAVVARPETVPEAPATRAPEAAAAASGPADLTGSRVLIVEDAVLLALELETGLSEAGAVVIGPAYELEEAMALLDRPIDAAVLDANLNGRSVTPVAEVLAARGIPFVFATGYGEAGGAPSGFDAPIIRKPYDVTQVASAVAQLLKRVG
ncbi:HWE histidine kinase domain-containing protein [Phenylobacterium sp.]|uniref:HWE histidine kinase domain-containing protein n=1 Tax=Phenylobacterium sp. TaxID=1871053 RepID=UPI002E37E633|nr:HWE histidine kinase domain-containing protein [Phenylobacterium sp.]HEX2558885.1 HWE histidine kinase domain-containing protein [Phenylobacterium sp.]